MHTEVLDTAEGHDIGPLEARGPQCGAQRERQPGVDDERRHLGRRRSGQREHAAARIGDATVAHGAVGTESDALGTRDRQLGDRGAAAIDEVDEAAGPLGVPHRHPQWGSEIGVGVDDAMGHGRRPDPDDLPGVGRFDADELGDGIVAAQRADLDRRWCAAVPVSIGGGSGPTVDDEQLGVILVGVPAAAQVQEQSLERVRITRGMTGPGVLGHGRPRW
ncbi:MAG: hypothetical protein EBX39_05960 [Actinobacteria bacterium]|nr:hypothetical protein [Actinomycetota bacterium]